MYRHHCSACGFILNDRHGQLRVLHGGGPQARLLAPAVMCNQLLPTAEQLARTGRLAGLPAVHCLANLAQLLTGCTAGSVGGHNQQLQAAGLAEAQAALVYVAAAVQLLMSASKADSPTIMQQQHHHKTSRAHKSHTGSNQRPQDNNEQFCAAAVLQDGCWMLGTQQHLLPLLQALQQHSPQGMVTWAGYCVHLLQDGSSSSSTSSTRNTSGRQGLGSSVLNVLAFAPKLLPSLWDWLARTAGLPLEAPLQASRGLDIAGQGKHRSQGHRGASWFREREAHQAASSQCKAGPCQRVGCCLCTLMALQGRNRLSTTVLHHA